MARHLAGQESVVWLMNAFVMKEFIAECRAHFNEPILLFPDVVRLIGCGQDDDDAYIIVQGTRHTAKKYAWAEDGIWRSTAVGGYMWLDRLKGQGYVKAHNGEDWDDLVRLDSWLALNGAPRRDEFLYEDRCGKEEKSTASE